MARFLAAHGWAPPDPLTLQLRENLPDSFYIVAATHIYGYPIDTLVVAPYGLVVLYTWEVQDATRANVDRRWRIAPHDDASKELHRAAQEARRCQLALEAFLKDEFPGLHPPIHHLVVLTVPDAKPMIEPDSWPQRVTLASVEETIVGLDSPLSKISRSKIEEPVREQLAFALRDRQLTHSQRTREPFIFRTGSRAASTVQEAIQHMDRHPSDGIYHLRNRTLVRWLRDEGAEHLATLAEEVMRQVTSDDRAMLESFLIGTGLVTRPLVTMRPARLEFGPIVTGEIASAVVRLQQKSGRGYLFGSLHASVPWLRFEPDHFAGSPVDVVISVDTSTLPIRSMPYTTAVEVASSASEASMPISVHFKVVGMPSRFERYLLRPVANLAVSGIIGMSLGTLLDSAGAITPTDMMANLSWQLVIGLLWAFVGAIQSGFQSSSLSSTRTLWLWVRRMALWISALFVVMAGFVWIGQELAGWLALDLPVVSPIMAGLAAATTSVIPAGFIGRRSSSQAGERRQTDQRPTRLRFVLAAGALVLALLLTVWFAPVDVGKASSQAKGRTGDWLANMETRLNQWTDELILSIYDRRAPAQPQ